MIMMITLLNMETMITRMFTCSTLASLYKHSNIFSSRLVTCLRWRMQNIWWLVLSVFMYRSCISSPVYTVCVYNCPCLRAHHTTLTVSTTVHCLRLDSDPECVWKPSNAEMYFLCLGLTTLLCYARHWLHNFHCFTVTDLVFAHYNQYQDTTVPLST